MKRFLTSLRVVSTRSLTSIRTPSESLNSRRTRFPTCACGTFERVRHKVHERSLYLWHIFPVNRSGRGERKARGTSATAIRPRIYVFRAAARINSPCMSSETRAIRNRRYVPRLFCIIRIAHARGIRGADKRRGPEISRLGRFQWDP